MSSFDEREMARNLHYLGVAPGQEDGIAHELVERFGWRKVEGRVAAVAHQVVVEPGAIVIQDAHVDPQRVAEDVAKSLSLPRWERTP